MGLGLPSFLVYNHRNNRYKMHTRYPSRYPNLKNGTYKSALLDLSKERSMPNASSFCPYKSSILYFYVTSLVYLKIGRSRHSISITYTKRKIPKVNTKCSKKFGITTCCFQKLIINLSLNIGICSHYYMRLAVHYVQQVVGQTSGLANN